MADQTLLPDPTSLHLLSIETEGSVITMVVRTTASEAKCSLCEKTSTKVHSRYTRLLADLPWMGYAVRLKLYLRRFFCQNPECQCQIFAERLHNVVAPYARRTLRLHDDLTLIGFAVDGEAGRKLAEGMAKALSSNERMEGGSHRSLWKMADVSYFTARRVKRCMKSCRRLCMSRSREPC